MKDVEFWRWRCLEKAIFVFTTGHRGVGKRGEPIDSKEIEKLADRFFKYISK